MALIFRPRKMPVKTCLALPAQTAPQAVLDLPFPKMTPEPPAA
jgi:hypothetical protein